MWTNVQFTGTLAPSSSKLWFTWGWPPAWHVVWYVVPTSNAPGGPEVGWDVAVERATADQATYWITVKNLSSTTMTFEARYAVLN